MYIPSTSQHRVFKYVKCRIMLARYIQTYMVTFRSVLKLIFSLTLHRFYGRKCRMHSSAEQKLTRMAIIEGWEGNPPMGNNYTLI